MARRPATSHIAPPANITTPWCVLTDVERRPGLTRQTQDRLEALFDAHHRRLYRLALRMSGDRDEAGDLVQQAFLQAARRPEALPEDGPGGEAWLTRVLVNLCRDRHRRRAVRRRLAPEPASEGTPAMQEAALMARQIVRAALARLAPRRRAVVVLHELEELDVEQVAGLLGIARATVRWHLAAGRRELKRILLEDEKR